MKQLLLPAILCCALGAQAQTIHKCYANEAIDFQERSMPGYRERVNEQFTIAQQWSQQHTPTRAIYTIPVVVHIVYNTQDENLSNAVIQDQIAVLNADYARLNADVVNMRSEFTPVAGATNVRFALATVDPDGNPTTGITRTQTTTESFGSFALFSGDMSDLEKVKSTANGGHDPWDQDHYLNIWVCDMSIFDMTMLLGYATPPDGLPNWPSDPAQESLGDGVVLQYQVVGSNNPIGIDGYEIKGRTATHEVGHYLGLRHIWGDGDCSVDDGIADTPDAAEASQQDCDMTRNSCNGDVMGLGDLHDMLENFMDYSAETCQNSFTQQQAALMHGVLENERYDLVHNNAALNTEELSNIAVNVYPNPGNALINVSGGNLMTSIDVIDMNGRLISTQQFSGFESTVDVSSLRTGMYIFSIRFDNGQIVRKNITKQ